MKRVSYSIQALPASHVAVLKAMILLTEKQAQCSWQMVDGAQAQVLFLGTGANTQTTQAVSAPTPHPGQIVISVGESANSTSNAPSTSTSAPSAYHLDLPLLFPRVSKLLLALTGLAAAEIPQKPTGFSNSALIPSVMDFGFDTISPPRAANATISRLGHRLASSAQSAAICARPLFSRANPLPRQS